MASLKVKHIIFIYKIDNCQRTFMLSICSFSAHDLSHPTGRVQTTCNVKSPQLSFSISISPTTIHPSKISPHNHHLLHLHNWLSFAQQHRCQADTYLWGMNKALPMEVMLLIMVLMKTTQVKISNILNTCDMSPQFQSVEICQDVRQIENIAWDDFGCHLPAPPTW